MIDGDNTSDEEEEDEENEEENYENFINSGLPIKVLLFLFYFIFFHSL